MLKVGSCTLYVQGLSGEQHALAEQFEAATSEHLALDHLDAVDDSLGWSITPGGFAGGLQFRPLVTQSMSELFQVRQYALDALNSVGEQRQLRLLSSRSTVLGVLWAVISVGGLITIAFSYFFGTKNPWSQMLMLAALSGVLALILFLILMLDHPFKGPVHVEPVAFQELQEVLGPW